MGGLQCRLCTVTALLHWSRKLSDAMHRYWRLITKTGLGGEAGDQHEPTEFLLVDGRWQQMLDGVSDWEGIHSNVETGIADLHAIASGRPTA